VQPVSQVLQVGWVLPVRQVPQAVVENAKLQDVQVNSRRIQFITSAIGGIVIGRVRCLDS